MLFVNCLITGINHSPSPPPPPPRTEQAPPRVASRQSQLTIKTIDIEGLAARNEERKRRLESILNSRRHTSTDQQEVSSAQDAFMSAFKEKRLAGHVTGHVTSEPSNVSLECETIFQQLSSSD